MDYFNKRLCDILKNVWAKIKDKLFFFKGCTEKQGETK